MVKLKRKFRDGSTHVVLDPLDFIARLAALVPRPRVHLVTYHGVLAPAASFRDRVVPIPLDEPENQGPEACASAKDNARSETPDKQQPRTRGPRRFSWADLLRRVYLIDVLTCPHCSGKRTVLAFLTEPIAIRRILDHLGLPTEAPRVASARAPPGELPFD